ncbi:MAG: RNA methyltransferase [Thermoleophilia bacterium]|nr:RNA methyltransferase [Thermoleophilia bacterium]
MITSAANPRLKLVRRLASRRQRERLGMFVCEGEDLVAAGLNAGIEPVEALVDAERPALLERLRGAEHVAPALLRGVSTLGHHARVVAVFRRADLPALADPAPPLGLALWRVADPGNLGTLLRAADAFGPAFVAISPGCADPTGPKALRASAGSVFRVPLGAFESAPRPWVALALREGTPLDVLVFGDRVTFVIGAEREGLPADVEERCDQRAWIRQTDSVDSLNVGIAGSIALWEWARRRPG